MSLLQNIAMLILYSMLIWNSMKQVNNIKMASIYKQFFNERGPLLMESPVQTEWLVYSLKSFCLDQTMGEKSSFSLKKGPTQVPQGDYLPCFQKFLQTPICVRSTLSHPRRIHKWSDFLSSLAFTEIVTTFPLFKRQIPSFFWNSLMAVSLSRTTTRVLINWLTLSLVPGIDTENKWPSIIYCVLVNSDNYQQSPQGWYLLSSLFSKLEFQNLK